MTRFMIMTFISLLSFTTFAFAQQPAAKIPTAAQVKEALKQDVDAVKKDAQKMKETVQQDLRENVEETKASLKDVRQTVGDEVQKLRK